MKGPVDWDARYGAAAGGLFGEAPCEYLREIAARSDLAPRTALFLADGDGRNGTWMAGQGVAVTAVDFSAEATRRARARDAAAGVAVERITADLALWRPEPGQVWDAVFLFYLHGAPELRRTALLTGAGALAPGGWLVVEGFSKAQASRAMGPDDPAKLYDLEELAAWLPGLAPVEALAGRILLDEGARHHGPAEVVRYAARRAA